MKRGRRSKLTPRKIKKITQAIRAGCYAKEAAQYAGIAESTFYLWLEKGKKAQSGKYVEFLESIKKAEAESQLRHVAIISKAADKNWRAAAWLLERRFPEKWGPRGEVSHSGQISLPEIRVILIDPSGDSGKQENI